VKVESLKLFLKANKFFFLGKIPKEKEVITIYSKNAGGVSKANRITYTEQVSYKSKHAPTSNSPVGSGEQMVKPIPRVTSAAPSSEYWITVGTQQGLRIRPRKKWYATNALDFTDMPMPQGFLHYDEGIQNYLAACGRDVPVGEKQELRGGFVGDSTVIGLHPPLYVWSYATHGSVEGNPPKLGGVPVFHARPGADITTLLHYRMPEGMKEVDFVVMKFQVDLMENWATPREGTGLNATGIKDVMSDIKTMIRVVRSVNPTCMIVLVGMNPINSARKPNDPQMVNTDPHALTFAKAMDQHFVQLTKGMYEVEFVSAVSVTAVRESQEPGVRLRSEPDPGNSVLLRPAMYNGPHLSTIANVTLARLVYRSLLMMLSIRKASGACLTRTMPQDLQQLSRSEKAYIKLIANTTPENFLRGSTQ
jgi:hypothetical protein